MVATLTCSRYFLDCLQLCLTEAKETKSTEGDWATGFIGSIFAGIASIWDVCIEAVFTRGASAWGIYIDAKLSDTSTWSSIK